MHWSARIFNLSNYMQLQIDFMRVGEIFLGTVNSFAQIFSYPQNVL